MESGTGVIRWDSASGAQGNAARRSQGVRWNQRLRELGAESGFKNDQGWGPMAHACL
jgi:hypothetical protein